MSAGTRRPSTDVEVVGQPLAAPAATLTARQLARLEILRRWSRLLDSAFRIPGTRVRFGWDPIAGLVPGLGDLVTPLFSVLVIAQALSVRIPKLVLLRMLANVVVDEIAGLVPGVGDLLDVGWKANTRNVRLLERHAREGLRPRLLDRLFGLAMLSALLAVAVVPLLACVWVLTRFGLF